MTSLRESPVRRQRPGRPTWLVALLVVVGDVDPAAVIGQVDAALGPWSSEHTAARLAPWQPLPRACTSIRPCWRGSPRAAFGRRVSRCMWVPALFSRCGQIIFRTTRCIQNGYR